MTKNLNLFWYIRRAPFSSLCIIPQQVPASRVLSVINGNIVALCGVDLTEGSSGQESENTCGLRVLTQRSSLCTCYGFGKNIFFTIIFNRRAECVSFDKFTGMENCSVNILYAFYLICYL